VPTAAEGAEALAGISREALLDGLATPRPHAVWMSGSLVEGLGNAGSDVDLFVAVERVDPAWSLVRQGSRYAVDVRVLGGRRVDYEYWTLESIEAVRARLELLPLDDPATNNLNFLAGDEVDFVHRLKVGVPLAGEAGFEEIRGRFDLEKFRRYLVQNAVQYVDDAFDDSVGMFEAGDLECAVLRARYTAELAVDVLLYHHGVTNDKAKYRAAKLRRLAAGDARAAAFREGFWRLQRHLPPLAEARGEYVKSALRLSSEIVEHVQREELRRGR